jgi:uncharacterized linocin/CFP29 family protein
MVGNDGAQVNLIQTIPGFGDAADRLIANDFDIGVLRPWVGGDGRHYHARTMGGKTRSIVTNTPATLTKEAWVLLDQAVVRAVRARLRAFADIRAAGLVFNLPNGMAHTVLQYQTVSDITSATVSMDPIRRSERDRPVLDLLNLPLPVVHKDFDFSAREIAVSRNGNVPLDTTMAELAGRKVAEEVEKMTVGNVASAFAYGGGAIYGYTNFPNRSTKFDVTVPTSSNGPTVLNDILALRQLLINNKHYGPYAIYFNPQWAQILDSDFNPTKGDQTFRQRLMAVEGFQQVQVLDFMPGTKWDFTIVELTTETVRAVVGMEIQTVQWESMGGMMKHFKVMGILVPQLRPDTTSNSGVGHGRTP